MPQVIQGMLVLTVIKPDSKQCFFICYIKFYQCGEQIWDLGSGVAHHVTLEDGKALVKSIYFLSSLVKVRNGILLSILHVGHSIVSTVVKQLHLHCILHVLSYIITFCLLGNSTVLTIIVWFFILFYSFKDNTTGDILLQAPSDGNIYLVSLLVEIPLVHANLVFSTLGDCWHCHVECYGALVLAILKKNHHLNVSTSFHDNCTACHLVKSHSCLLYTSDAADE